MMRLHFSMRHIFRFAYHRKVQYWVWEIVFQVYFIENKSLNKLEITVSTGWWWFGLAKKSVIWLKFFETLEMLFPYNLGSGKES